MDINKKLSLFGIKKGEWLKVFLLFLNFYLLIAIYTMIKSARSALVIQSMGADFLPYIWMITVFVLAGLISCYTRLVDRFSRQWVVAFSAIFFMINLFVIRGLLEIPNKWVTVIFYIWSDIFSVVMVEQFWSFANDIFTDKEAKRLYGVIGSGGIVGGLTGGALVTLVVPYVGTANMIFICIFLLVIFVASVFAIQRLIHNHKKDNSSASNTQALHQIKTNSVTTSDFSQTKNPVHLSEGFRLIATSRYLSYITLALVLVQVISALIDFQFSKAVEVTYPGLDQKSAFMGQFFLCMNIMSLTVMLFVFGPLNKKFGLLAGLLALPLMNLFGVILYTILPMTMIIFGVKLFDKGLNYSMNRASKEVLYIPTPKDVKYKVKAVIDMLVFRASKLFGAGIILVLITLDGPQLINATSLLLITVLILLTFQIHRLYTQMTGQTSADAKENSPHKVKKPYPPVNLRPSFPQTEQVN